MSLINNGESGLSVRNKLNETITRSLTAVQPSDLVGAMRTLWVDPAGDDTNSGDVPTSPFATITAALAAAEEGDIIRVRSGTYIEACPMIVPRDVSIFGDGLRNVEIRPTEATKNLNMFLVDSGAYFWGLTFANHQDGSFAIAFNEAADNTAIGASGLGAYISKSPYIQNCSSYTAAQDDGTAGSTSVGATGGGMEVDGAKCAPNSPIRSMVVDSYTQVNLNGPGCLVKNDAYAQLVSFFGTFCSYHVRAESGGQVNLSNSTSNFGTFGLVADGRSSTPIFSGVAAAALDGVNTITVDNLTASRIGPSSRPVSGALFEVAGTTYTITGSIPNGTGWDVNFFPTLNGALSGGETVEFFQRSQISTGGHVMEYVGAGTNYNALPWFGGVPIPANEIVEIGSGRVFFSTTDQLGNFRVGPQFDVNGTTGTVTINTDKFNLSGLNAIGPFSRDGIQAVGVQLQEVSNDVNLLASTGAADGNTAPTQFAVKSFIESRYTPTTSLATVATTGAYTDLSGLPTLATVATTGAYTDLSGLPTLATVATTGAYTDLSGLPTLGTAAALDVGTLANQVVRLDGSARLPAVDGSQLTNLPAGGDVTGPASAVDGHVALFDGTTGKLIKSAGSSLASFATLTGSETLTNKTLTDPRVNLGSDATGDMYYRAADGSLERLPVGTDTQVLTLASGLPSWSNSASGGIAFTRHTTTYTASANEGVIADTSGGVWTLTLPATPSAGDVVAVVDGADWGTNNLTVARNGSTIEGDAEDMTMDIGGVSVDFVYDGTTWHIYTQVGASDADVVKTTATQTLTNKTLTDPALIGAPVEDAYNLTGTDIDPANGTMQRKTTTGAETLTGTNFTVGQSVTLTLSAATSVSFTGFTWVSADGSAPTILSSNDTFVLWMDQGSNKYIAYLGGTV